MIPRKSNNWSVGREACRERNILTVLILPPQSRHLLVKERDTGYEMLEIHYNALCVLHNVCRLLEPRREDIAGGLSDTTLGPSLWDPSGLAAIRSDPTSSLHISLLGLTSFMHIGHPCLCMSDICI